MHPLKIGFLTSKNPDDKMSTSGTNYNMFRALKEEFEEVVLLGPVRINTLTWVKLKITEFFHRILYLKKYNSWHNGILARYFAGQFQEKLESSNVDVLFAPQASVEIALLETKIPICYFTDTTFSQIYNYYNTYRNYSAIAVEAADIIERKAIQKANIIGFSSEWASKHAVNYYNVDPDKIFIQKFGANLDSVPDPTRLSREYHTPLKLFFLGVNWERKGGDIAFETFKLLNDSGVHSELTVCGCKPPVAHPKMKVFPYLNKNVDHENKLLNQLFMENHLMFVPTRADCTPMIFSEAAAYGLPVITTDTGGVGYIIKNGINGYTLPYDSGASDYAVLIKSIFLDKKRIHELAKTSREVFENELNWNLWGKRVGEIITDAFKDNQSDKSSR